MVDWKKTRNWRREAATTLRPEWHFFWATSLTDPQMDEICAWLAGLTPQQRMYINKLSNDRMDEVRFDEAGESI